MVELPRVGRSAFEQCNHSLPSQKVKSLSVTFLCFLSLSLRIAAPAVLLPSICFSPNVLSLLSSSSGQSFANTLALIPSPLRIGTTYGIGLFWCKEDRTISDTLLTAASCLERGHGCRGPSYCVYNIKKLLWSLAYLLEKYMTAGPVQSPQSDTRRTTIQLWCSTLGSTIALCAALGRSPQASCRRSGI